jgi:NTE family protein
MVNVGLVLSGGGARAAYQVGAVRALSELCGTGPSPFSIFVGLSAGAINCTSLASNNDDFRAAARLLTETWHALHPDSVYSTEVGKLAGIGARWIKDLTLGGVVGVSQVNYLLDTSPLRALLHERIDFPRIKALIARGLVQGVAVSATNYLTGSIVTTYDGAPDIAPWYRTDRLSERGTVTLDHVMASAAIPLFFPPVVLDGKVFADGGVRMTTPTSPAIHLGADKLLAIGIRYPRSVQQTTQLNRDAQAARVTVAQIAGAMLNALFLDSLDNDLERIARINRTLELVPLEARQKSPDSLRRIPSLLLRPSRDLGSLAADEYQKFPAMLRHLLRGIGATGESGWDLVSYLAFQPGYVGTLMELGYEDTLARKDEIAAFFEAPIDDLQRH